MIRYNSYLLAILIVCLGPTATQAVEPNDTFGERTILGSGVLLVEDDLTPGFEAFPDTMLGIRDQFGEVYFVDDDGSPVGNGRASGVGGVPTNSGSIDFAVSGFPDEFFEGSHSEFGEYEVFVDVYDFFDDLVDSFSEVRTLQQGFVDEFSFSDFDWLNGSYDVYIDNTIGGTSPADVDYFTFTGLTSGSNFSAEVTDATSGFDSILGWFDGTGNLIESDDNDGFENLSLINGVVPANGQLTFAVTGFNDVGFVGDHSEDASYSLEVNLFSVSHPGDFDNDDDVDGRDFLRWQRKQSPNNGSLADRQAWQANYGYNGSLVAAQVVPEPTSLAILACIACIGSLSRKRLWLRELRQVGAELVD
jgi:hypothetical protein